MKAINFIALMLLTICANGQVIETGKTDNSVIVKNINVGFDVKEAEANVSFSNYFQPVAVKTKGVIWAINGKAKNEDGLVNWFNTGNFQPSSSINGVLGYYWTNVIDTFDKDLDRDQDSLTEIKAEKIKKEIYAHCTEMINDSVYNLSGVEKETAIGYLNSQLDKKEARLKRFEEGLKKKIASSSVDSKLDDLYKDFYDYLTIGTMNKQIEELYYFQTHTLHDRVYDIDNILTKRKFWTFKAYGTFGANADELTLFHGWDSATLSKNFTKEHFKGGNVGGGINVSRNGRWTIGIMDRYEESNNTDLLSTKKYSITTTITDSNQKAVASKDYEAYSASDYSKVYFNSLYVDVMHYFPLIKDSCIIVADLYFRNKNSNNQTIYPSNSTIGISAAIFKNSGKFVGGLYLELPDMNEKLAKKNPDYISKPFYNRMSFGVYAKISFSTLLKTL